MKAYLKYKDSDDLIELPFAGTPAEMSACRNSMVYYDINLPDGKMVSDLTLSFRLDESDHFFAVFEVEAF